MDAMIARESSLRGTGGAAMHVTMRGGSRRQRTDGDRAIYDDNEH